MAQRTVQPLWPQRPRYLTQKIGLRAFDGPANLSSETPRHHESKTIRISEFSKLGVIEVPKSCTRWQNVQTKNSKLKAKAIPIK